jgi:hypothetical protein
MSVQVVILPGSDEPFYETLVLRPVATIEQDRLAPLDREYGVGAHMGLRDPH